MNRSYVNLPHVSLLLYFSYSYDGCNSSNYYFYGVYIYLHKDYLNSVLGRFVERKTMLKEDYLANKWELQKGRKEIIYFLEMTRI